jgi:hypothetical protein
VGAVHTEPLRPEWISTTDDPESLLKHWARGRFQRLAKGAILDNVRRHLDVELHAEVSEAQLDALRMKLAAFLRAYSSGSFEDYLSFRDAEALPDSDDERLRMRLAEIAQVVQRAGREPPRDALGALRDGWEAMLRQNGDPPIRSVNWDSCQVSLRSLAPGEVIAEEWGPRAGIYSHFFREFRASRRANISLVVPHLRIPLPISAKELAARQGRLLFADFEIRQEPPGEPASPLLLRFIWGGEDFKWLALNAMRLYNSGPSVLFW